MSTFVVVLGWPWSEEEDAEQKALACFNDIVSAAPSSPLPYEFDVLVAPVADFGTSVVIYLENSFTGAPKDLGSHNFYDDLIPWLEKVTEGKIGGPEFFGPRSYPLDQYWGPLKIRKQKRIGPSIG